jgi:tRNA (guanine37-N1)-methyltransferase
MRFDIITLFPDLFGPVLQQGITRRAFESGQVEVRLWPLRDHAEGPYRRVDDRPFGGGPGMVMMADPLFRCWQAVQADRQACGAPRAPTVLFSPIGERLTQAVVGRFAAAGASDAPNPGAILVCGRYEGLDQRFIDACVDQQISLGDFVLSGGEIPAMALLDAVARLQPEVLSDAGSHQQDSFSPLLQGMLDCPHFTRPEVWQSPQGPMPVPAVLLSGHHARIEQWRAEQRLQLTRTHRPDLLPD